jgi:hypothetical protein
MPRLGRDNIGQGQFLALRQDAEHLRIETPRRVERRPSGSDDLAGMDEGRGNSDRRATSVKKASIPALWTR